ncbi:hypothetical protein J1614_000887 [Plenodomus biglobosus]|nr:hypothetical protein J1614_000887 [Plenodomus biglobosus]
MESEPRSIGRLRDEPMGVREAVCARDRREGSDVGGKGSRKEQKLTVAEWVGIPARPPVAA